MSVDHQSRWKIVVDESWFKGSGSQWGIVSAIKVVLNFEIFESMLVTSVLGNIHSYPGMHVAYRQHVGFT